jgi:hypothetical protein
LRDANTSAKRWRFEVGQVHHVHRDACGDDQRDGEGLRLHFEEIAQKLSVKR